jgi:acyl-CoA thioesterase-1
MNKILLPALLSVFLLTACGGDEPAEPAKKETSSKKPPKKKPNAKGAAKDDKAARLAAENASIERREAADLLKKQNGILIIGDSFSAGEGLSSEQSWPGVLAHRLSKSDPPIPVVNASLSGDTASGGVSRIGWQLAKYNPKLIVLALGSRDLAQQNDLSQVQKDLATVIKTAKANRVEVLLVGAKTPASVPQDYQLKADAMFLRLSMQEKVRLVPDLMAPLNRLTAINPDATKNLNANREIQPALVDNMWPTLYMTIKQAGFKISLPEPAPIVATPLIAPAAPVVSEDKAAAPSEEEPTTP